VRSPTWTGMGGVAAIASIGAGMIHVAAAVAHADERQAMAVFMLIAVCQVGWGALALAGAGPTLRVTGAFGNAAVLGGWLAAKTVGIPFVDGLEAAEPVQLADGLAAGLAAAAVVFEVAPYFRDDGTLVRALSRPAVSAGVALLVVTVTVMGTDATTQHAHGHGDHPHATRPFHPDGPIDLGGVPGVTPQQQARAENLVAVTLLRLPRYADVATAEADGFRSIGDAASGYEHYINWPYVDDGKVLDPDYPESLVYRVHAERRSLVAAMYMLPTGTTLHTAPDIGGALTQWHVHDDLCLTKDPETPVVAGLTAPGDPCPPPLARRVNVPMLHVWIVPHECGPFASLEGIAAGQVRPGEERLCDHAHGSH
jgi:hypothetical protein